MEKIELKATKREVLGKKVRALRRDGMIPVHLFGSDVEPTPLQCDALDLKHVLDKAGKTHLVDLKVDKAKKITKALYIQSTMAEIPAPRIFRLFRKMVSASPIPIPPLMASSQ